MCFSHRINVALNLFILGERYRGSDQRHTKKITEILFVCLWCFQLDHFSSLSTSLVFFVRGSLPSWFLIYWLLFVIFLPALILRIMFNHCRHVTSLSVLEMSFWRYWRCMSSDVRMMLLYVEWASCEQLELLIILFILQL